MNSSESVLVWAAASQTLDGQTPESIVYLPKGEWKITPTVNGKAGSVEVMVDSDAAKVLQESLNTRLKDTVRPHAAFDHKPGPASFIPKAFKWDDDRGVILEIDWTKSGREAVAGRDYSYFSPTFLLKDKKVVGLPKDGEIGSLTNNPAFRRIQRIAASADQVESCTGTCPECGKKSTFDNNDPGDNVTCPGCGKKYKLPKKAESTMNKVAEKLVELQVITAQQAESEDEDFLIRAISGLHGNMVIVQKANDLLKAENTNLLLKVQAVQAAEADQIIEAVIAEGKIPAKDAETIKFFKDQYLVHPEQTKKVLAALTGNSTILGEPIVKIKSGDHVTTRSGAEIVEAQQNLIKEIRENNPNLSFDSAFNRARAQRPELFVEA